MVAARFGRTGWGLNIASRSLGYFIAFLIRLIHYSANAKNPGGCICLRDSWR